MQIALQKPLFSTFSFSLPHFWMDLQKLVLSLTSIAALGAYGQCQTY